MKILLDPGLPQHWVSRIEAGAQMAMASGVRYGMMVGCAEADLIVQGLRNWPAVVVRCLTPDEGDGRLSAGGPDPVPVVGYVSDGDLAQVARALNGGRPLQGLLIEGVSDKPWDVLEALQCAQRHLLPKRLEGDLAEIAGEKIGRLSIRALLDGRRIDVTLMAELYGRSPRTLRRHFAARGLPRPERWVGWLTTLAASAYLSTSRRTIASAAFLLGYNSGSALSQVCRRLTGSGLSTFRGPRGWQAVLADLRNDCGGEAVVRKMDKGRGGSYEPEEEAS